MERLLQDLRYALRTLGRTPGFTAAAVLTLALGIGANATIFSLVNGVLLRPPAQVAEPERLVALFTSDYSGPPFGTSSYPDYETYRQQADVFAGVAAYTPRGVSIGDGDDLERTGMEVVSENFFQVLGVRPLHGRFFLPEEGTAPGAHAVAVISHELWRRRFAGDPAVVGSSIPLSGQSFTVVGVAPEAFTGAFRGLAADVWVPVTAPRLGLDAETFTGRGSRMLFLMARLREGITMEQAQARMEVVARQLHAAYPDSWTDLHDQGRRISLLSERAARVPPQVRGPVLGFTALLMATAGLVLLICCANVASLMLARASGRTREIGVRLSLGASRGRIVRQLLTESLVLAAAGAVVGVVLAAWATGALMAFEPPIRGRIHLDLGLDARVLLFTTLIALVAAVSFGLAPALRASRPDLTAALKSEMATLAVGTRRLSLRNALVVGQIAMSLVLLVCAFLFLRSLQRAAGIDPGFATERMLLVSLEPPPELPEEADGTQVAAEVRERLAAAPGVLEASWASYLPLGLERGRRGTTVEGYQPREGEDMEFHFSVVGPRFFETLQLPIVRGRGFTAEDAPGAAPVVVVNESFARRFWPDEDPLTKRLSLTGPEGPYLQVVGVARDAKYLSLTEEPLPYVYSPALQDRGWYATLLVRTAGEPHAALEVVRRTVEEVAPGWSALSPRTLEEQIGASLLPQRLASGVLGLFGALALLLAAVGLYGVVAFAVTQRTREIGIRMALGADRAAVHRLVLGQGMGLVVLGLGIGLVAAWAVASLLSSLLLGLSTRDPLTFASAPLLLAAVALLASYLPARRAARVDPMIALRAE